jgi:hypothetical protein
MRNEAMKQIAIRLPHDMLDQIGERFCQLDRTAVIHKMAAHYWKRAQDGNDIFVDLCRYLMKVWPKCLTVRA